MSLHLSPCAMIVSPASYSRIFADCADGGNTSLNLNEPFLFFRSAKLNYRPCWILKYRGCARRYNSPVPLRVHIFRATFLLGAVPIRLFKIEQTKHFPWHYNAHLDSPCHTAGSRSQFPSSLQRET